MESLELQVGSLKYQVEELKYADIRQLRLNLAEQEEMTTKMTKSRHELASDIIALLRQDELACRSARRKLEDRLDLLEVKVDQELRFR